MKFVLNKNNKNSLIKKIESLDKEKTWTISINEYESQISPEQNKYYRKMLRAWASYKPLLIKFKEQNKYAPSPEEWHEYFKDKYLSETKPFGNTTIKIQRSSQELTVAQMIKYVDTIKIFCYETIGFEFGEEEI